MTPSISALWASRPCQTIRSAVTGLRAGYWGASDQPRGGFTLWQRAGLEQEQKHEVMAESDGRSVQRGG